MSLTFASANIRARAELRALLVRFLHGRKIGNAGNNQKRTRMRSKLLLSTAALLAGMALASAQNMPGGGNQPSGAQPHATSPSGSQPNAQNPADKSRQPATTGQREPNMPSSQIGRASCRERGTITV